MLPPPTTGVLNTRAHTRLSPYVLTWPPQAQERKDFSFDPSCPLPHLSACEDSQPESKRTYYHLETLSFRAFLSLGAADGLGPGRAPPHHPQPRATQGART